jgi:hypothetical protein
MIHPSIHCTGFHQRQELHWGLYITRALATCGIMDEELDEQKKLDLERILYAWCKLQIL